MITLKKSSMKYKDPQDGSMKDVGAIIGENVGKDGKDGFSPIAKVEENENGATITIIDKNGETSVNIENGKDGNDGQDGENGQDGKSAYQYAQEGGYERTEEEFAAKLAKDTYAKEEIDTMFGTYVDEVAELVDENLALLGGGSDE